MMKFGLSKKTGLVAGTMALAVWIVGCGGSGSGSSAVTTASTATSATATTAGTATSTTATQLSYGTPVQINGPAGTTVEITGHTNNKQLCGYYGLNDGAAPAYWPTPSSPMVALKNEGLNGYAWGLNSHGQIVGQTVGTDISSVTMRALVWSSPTATARVLPVPPGTVSSYAYSINDSGQIVGVATDSNKNGSLIFWASPTASTYKAITPSGGAPILLNSGVVITSIYPGFAVYKSITDTNPTKILPPAGATQLNLKGLNSSGELLGGSDYLIGNFLYNPPSYQATPVPLGSEIDQSKGVSVSSLNDAGAFVGSATVNNVVKSYIWLGNGKTGTPLLDYLPKGTVDFALGEVEQVFDDYSLIGKMYAKPGTAFAYAYEYYVPVVTHP